MWVHGNAVLLDLHRAQRPDVKFGTLLSKRVQSFELKHLSCMHIHTCTHTHALTKTRGNVKCTHCSLPEQGKPSPTPHECLLRLNTAQHDCLHRHQPVRNKRLHSKASTNLYACTVIPSVPVSSPAQKPLWVKRFHLKYLNSLHHAQQLKFYVQHYSN